MAIELKRGCGYRKIGDLYLISRPISEEAAGVTLDPVPDDDPDHQ